MVIASRRLKWFLGGELRLVHGAWLCVLAGLALAMIGLYAIDIGTEPVARGGAPIRLDGLVLRQLVYLGVGVLAACIVALPHVRFLRWLSWPAMIGCLVLLIFLLIPGVPSSIVRARNGARAWIELGIIDLQPSELAKIAFVLVMAEYLRLRENHRTWLGLIPPAVIAFVPAALITLQPDLGMAMLFAPAILAMLLVAGARTRHLLLVVVIALAAAPVTYPLLKPHQKARIQGLISLIKDPSAGADGINYQALRSQMLAGAGQIAGVPDAKARSLHRFNELPERHNDMILSVILTRFGMIGGLVVFGLYGLWFLGAYITAARCSEGFGQLVVVGFMAIVFAQTFINMGMVLGVLPIIGLTLPFVSYGGTSMVTVWLMTGIIVSIAMRPPERLARPTFEFSDRPMSYGASRPLPRIAPKATRRSA